mmetsp:Transcript_8973/g.19205  ORF Transcript_8973/g.19205 Transcript_8973/m.19205 type:complete len:546 (+) Transcript_8973:118-1755(+)|eukprot:CAMPEP_0202893230 /NCGR_PEP_ID=MMETSP1392-20130828/2840_1 /ASSEMBLY_ACC=CAM_ASM_000868 /TAXON_ID=225041 /ORGANISM="Chlamydomonas chlamydogama, Strain SAG 11-48b" /LENGTH=545 /DNA_ID=CAMNT_0049577483 /DNA_START=96 /DNA_END=1733 /DNA_ORIENTATION=-
MGNSASTAAERALEACSANNLADLSAVLAALPSDINNAARRAVLESRDKDGRSLIIIASAKGYHQVAKLLLQNGADVNFMNIKEDKGGTALHEAASRRNEAMVELLLQYGANPFMANPSGATAMDLAVLAGAGNIIRRFEQQALFVGSVDMKWATMAGLSSSYKQRHVVVMDHLPCPKEREPTVRRKQLWVYKDLQSVNPRCRLWLDGAQAFKAGTGGYEGIIRLHTSHAQPPAGLFTRFDRGYCIFVRPVGCGNGLTPSAPSPAAAQAYDALMSLCNLHEEPALPASGGSMLAGRPPSASMALPPRSPMAQVAPGSPAPHMGPGNPPGGVGTLLDIMQAVPGETDAEFAARLASAISASSGGSIRYPGSSAPSTASPLSSTHASSGGGGISAGGGSSTGGSSRASAGNTASSGQVDMHALAAAAAAVRAAAAPQLNSPRGPTQHASSSPYEAHPQQGGGSLAGSSWRAPPSPHKDVAPSAPPAPAPADEDEALCVICLSAGREAGFLHGTTVHKCVCQDCSRKVSPGTPCPLCRQPIERVLGVY